MPRTSPQVTRRGNELKDETRIVSSKDLTKKGLSLYLFGDFLVGLYLAACLFLDLIIVAPLYTYVPGFTESIRVTDRIFSFPVMTAYYVILILFIESVLIYFEVRYMLIFRSKMNYKDHELKKQ